MKYWISGALALCFATGAAAEGVQLVSSPALKLDFWVDNIKNTDVASWCRAELPLRVVSHESRDPHVLDDYLPRLASLLSSQCPTLNTLKWQMNDGQGEALASGEALKRNKWAVMVDQPAPPEPTPAAPLSPPADTTAWQQFDLLNGCHFRTYWMDDSASSALFVPGKSGMKCGDDGWLTGQSNITLMGSGAAKSSRITFLAGFPISGLKRTDNALHITTVNNQRMVLSNDKSPQSWLILPWQPQQHSWSSAGSLAVQMNPQEAADPDAVKARLAEVRNAWNGYLSNGDKLSVALIANLSPQLQDPTAGAFRTVTQEQK